MISHKNATLYINYEDKTVSFFDGKSIVKSSEMYGRHNVVPIGDLEEFVRQDYNRAVEDKVDYIVGMLKKEMEIELHEEVTKLKMKLAADALKQISVLRDSLQKMFSEEFSVGDPDVVHSIVSKSVKLMAEDSLSKVFVSKTNFEIIKKKIGEPVLTVLGVNAPIGIGYNLSETQVMVEGGKTVVVSDLSHILSKYLDQDDG